METTMKPGQPDISQIGPAELKTGRFPRLDEPAYRISIAEAAYRAVKDHAGENPSIEICGVLVGDVLKDEEGPFLIITAAIRGENAAAQAGQVTFTQDAWSHILETKDAQYPDLRIVGWYHSHPAFGIFFSAQDQFIQTTLFGQPWQVAFVVDPVSGEEGFFVWHKGVLSRAGRFWVDGLPKSALEPPNPGPLIARKVDKLLAALRKPEPQRFPGLYYYGGLLLFGLLCLVFYLNLRSVNDRMLAFIDDAIRFLPQAAAVSGATSRGHLKDDALARLRQNALLAPLNIRVAVKGDQVWCSGEVYTWAQKDLVGRIIQALPGVGSVDLQGLTVTHAYQVAEGDTLETVALRVYGDIGRAEQIHQANRDLIEDPRKIAPPLRLRLPE